MDEMHLSSGNTEAILRELVLRFATDPGVLVKEDLQLLVERVPEDLLFSLPLSEGSSILGSLIRTNRTTITTTDIALDTPLSPWQAIDFYREHLHREGWFEQERTPGFERSGFANAHRGRTDLILWQYGSSVHIRAEAGRYALTAVRLTIYRGQLRDNSVAMDFLQGRVQIVATVDPERAFTLIPRLEAPMGAVFRDDGYTSALYSAQTCAMLQTDLSLSVLATHYATQLEQAHWQRTGEGSSGPAGWHTWTFQDEEQETWSGYFFVLQTPGRSREYSISMRISRDNNDRRDWVR